MNGCTSFGPGDGPERSWVDIAASIKFSSSWWRRHVWGLGTKYNKTFKWTAGGTTQECGYFFKLIWKLFWRKKYQDKDIPYIWHANKTKHAMYQKVCNVLTYITKNKDCKDHKSHQILNILTGRIKVPTSQQMSSFQNWKHPFTCIHG